LLPVNGAVTPATQVLSGHPTRELHGRYAIGATATLHLSDGRLLVQQVDSSNGHSGKRSPVLHFGLGRLPASTPVTVDLAWRDGSGAVHRETLQLTPGLHTILLASPRNEPRGESPGTRRAPLTQEHQSPPDNEARKWSGAKRQKQWETL
jgi:hypothetical protein